MTDRRSPIAQHLIVAAFLCGWVTSSFAAEEPKKEKTKITFEEHVLPILKARCVKCRAGAEPAQGLRLATRREILRGGKSGPAMRIAAAESSLLWEKLASNEMPKGGPALSAAEKGIIRSWINDGAASTDTTDDDANELKENTGQQPNDRWAFRPPVRPPVPNVRIVAESLRDSESVSQSDTGYVVRNPIDSFVIATLNAKGLNLSPEASREVLLRR